MHRMHRVMNLRDGAVNGIAHYCIDVRPVRNMCACQPEGQLRAARGISVGGPRGKEQSGEAIAVDLRQNNG